MNPVDFFPDATKITALPTWGSPRLYIPANSLGQRWRRSSFYPAYRKSAMAYKLLLRSRIALMPVSTVVGGSDGHTWEVGVFIRDVLPEVTSISLLVGTQGPAQKMTLQLCDENDRVCGYMKYGESPSATAALENEARILKILPDGVGPTLLKSGTFRDGAALVTTSVDGSGVSATLPPPTEVISFHTTLMNGHQASTESHPGLVGLRTEMTMSWLDDLSDRTWPVAIQHGDFAPWNLKLLNGDVTAFDWEFGIEDGFPYLDLAFFSIQTDVKIYHASPVDAFRRAQKILEELAQLSPVYADALVRLAAYDAFLKARKAGHGDESDLQQWYRSVWEASV